MSRIPIPARDAELMEYCELTAISPVDGRYADKSSSLRSLFSEFGLIRNRLRVEVEWLKLLANHTAIVECEPFGEDGLRLLDGLCADFSLAEAKLIKQYEQQTNHDVKAVELFLGDFIEQHEELQGRKSFIHFACTSEDINNLAYALLLQEACQICLSSELEQLMLRLTSLADKYRMLPMMCRTHGQAATPSTLGREIAVFVWRLLQWRKNLHTLHFSGKCNGATGNFNAHICSYPRIDWMQLTEDFVANRLGLQWNPHTTQIEPHDDIVRLMHAVMHLNAILTDLACDLWAYISIGYFRQAAKTGEVGSSTMPHKVNPIDFENAEGNSGLAVALATHLAQTLPISRWQRDLSDSTTLRNLGLVFAYTQIALRSLSKGIEKLAVDESQVAADLEANWQLLAEAVQTMMRRYGHSDAYEQLKLLTRGKTIDRAALHDFIGQIDLPEEARQKLLALTPATYLGNAVVQTDRILQTVVKEFQWREIASNR